MEFILNDILFQFEPKQNKIYMPSQLHKDCTQEHHPQNCPQKYQWNQSNHHRDDSQEHYLQGWALEYWYLPDSREVHLQFNLQTPSNNSHHHLVASDDLLVNCDGFRDDYWKNQFCPFFVEINLLSRNSTVKVYLLGQTLITKINMIDW